MLQCWKLRQVWDKGLYFLIGNDLLIFKQQINKMANNYKMLMYLGHTWCALYVFFCDGEFLYESVGILSACKYSWSIGLQIVFIGTHGVHCLCYFVMGNSCLRQLTLEFWGCANILNHFIYISVSPPLYQINLKSDKIIEKKYF